MPALSSSCLTIHRIELPTPFPVGTVNVYLLEAGHQRVLIDCGLKYPPAQRALDAGLAERGLTLRDITALVLTHGHVDHVGWAAGVQSAGATVYAPPGVDTWLNPSGPWEAYRAAFYTTLYRKLGAPNDAIEQAMRTFQFYQTCNDRSVVDVVLSYGAPLPILPNFQVLHVPGHAQHALALWDAEQGVLFGGDQVLAHISSNPLIEPVMTAERGEDAERTQSLLQYRESLRFLRSLPIRTVYPGHGAPFHDVADCIDGFLAGQERRREKFCQLLSRRPATAYELAVTYFARHREQVSLILSETLGYLDWLREEGRAVCEDDGGVWVWRAVAADQ
ncbi:MAG: MBL fold metallo-hydrolase [Alicyclobacillus sp.]|nr:MBL fold metallo-hydrolase [Alicyclobacillus sp.]